LARVQREIPAIQNSSKQEHQKIVIDDIEL